MKFLSIVLFLLAINVFSVPASADQTIDITGIYQSISDDKDYLTINRSDDQYILVNISRNLNLLYKLELITEQEFKQPIIKPAVEEFAFTFQLDSNNLKLPVGISNSFRFIPDIIIPFPDRTTHLTALQYPVVSFRINAATDAGVVTTTEEKAPYCLISLDIARINNDKSNISIGFNKFTSPEFVGTEQSFISINQYYKKIF